MTGAVTDAEYAAWLDRAAVAVQLRRSANGESSGTVADCLASGAVPIVSGIGAGRDLPADGVVSVGPSVTAAELAPSIADLLADPDRRRDLAVAGRAYAAAHSHAVVARRLFEDVIEPATRRPQRRASVDDDPSTGDALARGRVFRRIALVVLLVL